VAGGRGGNGGGVGRTSGTGTTNGAGRLLRRLKGNATNALGNQAMQQVA